MGDPMWDELVDAYAYDEATDTYWGDNDAAARRWLAQHDREVAAKALREAANEMPRQWCQTDGPSDWLDDRADRIERGDDG